MSVTLHEPERVGERSYRVTWSSDKSDPLFRVYRDGDLVGTTRAAEWTFQVASGEAPVIEVRDDALEPSAVPDGRLLIQCDFVDGAEEYRFEEDVSGTWTPRRTIEDDGESAVFSYRTRRLARDTTHTWRVVAVGADGNESVAQQVSALMVRVPDPPALSFDYDEATGDLSVTA